MEYKEGFLHPLKCTWFTLCAPLNL